ncbi:MAG: septum formation protein Maf [Deltaproteobacteria bacterium]|nr:septum formation protein Maf [Deltaproteobacteria bacterium]
MALLLASTSHARRALLSALGVPFTCEPPGVDEQVPPGTPPREAVAQLAGRKAHAVAARHPQDWVLGSDQLLDLDGRALGKPADRAAAEAQLRALSGRTHLLHTGVCLVGPGGRAETAVETARLALYPLTDAEVHAYLDTGEWEGCAGGYRVEGRGQALFSALEGDRTCVQGLPMLQVVRLLRQAAIPLLGGTRPGH